ncbi:MAG: electron transfer flavoprotein subunit alpha/FixB family protein [Halobacteriales archaeon]
MVLALVEHDDGEAPEESLQALTLARSVADGAGETLSAAAFGDGVDDLAPALEGQGVEALHRIEHDDLDGYAPRALARALDQLADELDATAVVAPGTDRGQEVLAHLGALADRPVAANCLTVEVGDEYDITRQRWGGSLIEHARIGGDRKLLTVALHELPVEADAGGESPAIQAFEPDLDAADTAVSVERFEPSEEEGIALADADIVIGGGRGVGSAEGFEPLEELAAILDAAVGSSRAAVNEGWRPHDDQIGLTGERIAPEIYIAAGISGAVQHMVGTKGAKHILAINTDPEAGIIQKSSWAVLGDLHEVVPAITEELRARGYD